MSNIVYVDFTTKRVLSKEEHNELYPPPYESEVLDSDMLQHMLDSTKYHKAGMITFFADMSTGEYKVLERHRKVDFMVMKSLIIGYLEEKE